MTLSMLYDSLIVNTVPNNDHFKWSQVVWELKDRKERQQETLWILVFSSASAA